MKKKKKRWFFFTIGQQLDLFIKPKIELPLKAKEEVKNEGE